MAEEIAARLPLDTIVRVRFTSEQYRQLDSALSRQGLVHRPYSECGHSIDSRQVPAILPANER